MIRIVPLVLATLLLASCASTPTVHTDADPAANFSSYRTYTWLPHVKRPQFEVRYPLSKLTPASAGSAAAKSV